VEVGERLGQLARHIDSSDFPAFRGRHFAMGVVALNQQEATLEIKIAPLKGEEFAQSQSGASRTEK
jgi:hypothetical protein